MIIPGPPRLPSPAADIALVLVGQLMMLAVALLAARRPTVAKNELPA